MSIRHFCDGCTRELREEPLAASNAVAMRFISEHPEAQGMLGEVFCHICLLRADQYWTEKITVLREVMDVSRRRLDNFRKAFWSARPMKVVK
jgi:hypothetical protein